MRDRLRLGLFLYIFLLTVVDNPFTAPFNGWNPLTESLGPWLYANLKSQYGIPLPLSLVEWIPALLALAAYHGQRKIYPSLSIPRDALLTTILFFLALVGAALLSATLRGGDATAVYWALKGPLVLPGLAAATFLLVRTEQHMKTLAWVALAGITLKSLQGMYYYLVILGGDRGANEYITTHTGSYVMSCAILCTAALWAFRPSGFHTRQRILALIALAIILPAFVLNERRIEMVGLLASFLLLLGMMAWCMPRRALLTAVAAVGFSLLYFAAFRYTKGPLGAPVAMVESLLDDSNSSNLYRAIENFDLVETLLQAPLLGQGLGIPFRQILPLPDISALYEFYLVNPHNSLLWIWSSLGLLGMLLFGWWLASHVFLGVNAFLRTQSATVQVGVFLCLANILRYLLFCHGDMMLFNSEGNAVLGISLGLIWSLTALSAPAERSGATRSPNPPLSPL